MEWKQYIFEGKVKKPNPYANASNISDKKANREVIKTDHAIDRFWDGRYEESDASPDIKELLKDKKKFTDKVTEIVKSAMKIFIGKYGDKEQIFGLYSKSTKIGLIINWRPDNQKPSDKRNHAIIVTVLPVKNSPHFKSSDTKVVVEGIEYNPIYIEID